MEDEVKKVSKKKMIFIQIDDEITSIFDRIEKLAYKDIYLVIPKRAVLFQSVVNLKILKQKMDDLGKTLFIITDDTNGMKLAHQSEIKVFDHYAKTDDSKAGAEVREESALLKPIAATSNDVAETQPSRLPQKKSTIFEIVRTLKTSDQGFSFKTYLRERKLNKLNQAGSYFNSLNKRSIVLFLGASIAVFFFIAYVALPGATINIVPASTVITKGANIVLQKNPSDPKDLKVYDLSAEAETTLTYQSSGTKSQGSIASGNLIVYNISNKNWPLIPETRFQTSEGLVFRIKEEIEVPAGSTENPGQIQVHVVADEKDANGTNIGERGNIGPSKFFLPGLRDANRNQLYGESTEYMTGGTTQVSTFVTDEDLLAAGAKLEAALKEKALSALRKEALAQSTANGIQLALLEDSDIIQYGAPEISLPREIIGKEQTSFEVIGKMKITGAAYNSETLLSILKSDVIGTKTPGKRLVKIDENSISINVFEVNLNSDTYKFTAQIQGIEEYEIDPDLEGGNKLAKKIKEHIAGKTVEEAENYIQNLPEVNSVEIKMWPFWSPTIPSLPDNIKIKSLSQGEVIQ